MRVNEQNEGCSGMHKIVMEDLERHLAGNTSPVVREHLEACNACQSEVMALAGVSALLRSLQPNDNETMQPRAGFYGRVACGIVEHQRSSAWGMFAPGALFFRRIAFASLLTLAALGSYLLTSQSEFSVNEATAILARNTPDVNDGGAAAPESQRSQILLALSDWTE